MADSQFEDILRKKALGYKPSVPADLLTNIKATSGLSSATTAGSTGAVKTVIAKFAGSLTVKLTAAIITASTSGYFIADHISTKNSSSEQKIELVDLPNSQADSDNLLNNTFDNETRQNNQGNTTKVFDFNSNHRLDSSIKNSEKEIDSNLKRKHDFEGQEPKHNKNSEEEITSNIGNTNLPQNKERNITDNNNTTINKITKNSKFEISSTPIQSKQKNENEPSGLDQSKLDTQITSAVIVDKTKGNDVLHNGDRSDNQETQTSTELPVSSNNLNSDDKKGSLAQDVTTEQKSGNSNLLTKNNSKEESDSKTNLSVIGIADTIENTNSQNLNVEKSELAESDELNETALAPEKEILVNSIQNNKITDSSNEELLTTRGKSDLDESTHNNAISKAINNGEVNENSSKSILFNMGTDKAFIDAQNTSNKQSEVNQAFVVSDTIATEYGLNNNSLGKLSAIESIAPLVDRIEHTEESLASNLAHKSEIAKDEEMPTIINQPDSPALSETNTEKTTKKKESTSFNSTNKYRTGKLKIFTPDSKVEKLDRERQIWLYPFVQAGTSILINHKETERGLNEKRTGSFLGGGLALHYQFNKKLELGFKSVYQEISLETNYLSNGDTDGTIKQDIQLFGIKGGGQHRLLHTPRLNSYILNYWGVSYKLSHKNNITGKYFEQTLSADLTEKNSLSFNGDLSIKLNYMLNDRIYIETALLFEYLYINKRTEILNIGGLIGLKINL